MVLFFFFFLYDCVLTFEKFLRQMEANWDVCEIGKKDILDYS